MVREGLKTYYFCEGREESLKNSWEKHVRRQRTAKCKGREIRAEEQTKPSVEGVQRTQQRGFTDEAEEAGS